MIKIIFNKFILKKFFLALGLFSLCSGWANAQQLTRFAVVDLSRVYSIFFRESRAVREFEERSARVQSDIDRMTADIQSMRANQISAEFQGNRALAQRLESEINQRTEQLREYHQLRTAELELQRSRLAQSDTFLEEVYDMIRSVAEREGYSMVLNLRDNTGILWFSPTVDITDMVIDNLMRSRR